MYYRCIIYIYLLYMLSKKKQLGLAHPALPPHPALQVELACGSEYCRVNKCIIYINICITCMYVHYIHICVLYTYISYTCIIYVLYRYISYICQWQARKSRLASPTPRSSHTPHCRSNLQGPELWVIG